MRIDGHELQSEFQVLWLAAVKTACIHDLGV